MGSHFPLAAPPAAGLLLGIRALVARQVFMAWLEPIFFLFVAQFPFFFSDTERDILLGFYNGLEDNGTLNWNTTEDICGWTGVNCNEAGDVVKL